jgi:parallel beta-helix repeat protein
MIRRFSLMLLVGAVVVAAPIPSCWAAECTLTLPPRTDLEKAIERLPAQGAPVTVCLTAGEFRLRRFLSIRRNDFRLRGRGASTVLRLDEGVNSPVIVVGDYAHRVPSAVVRNVTIENLRVVGSGRVGSEFDGRHPYLTNSAVVVRAGRRVEIRGLDVSACRSACILTEHGSDDITIADNTVSGSVWDGISLNRTSRARVLGNRVRGNTGAGITTEHLEDSVVEANTVSDNLTHGVYLSDSYRNTFIDNRFTGNVLSGVFLTCAVRSHDPVLCWDDSMSRGNTFEGNEFVGNRVGYMVAADTAANCTRPGFEANVSSDDRFVPNRNEEPDWATYGRCLSYRGPR